MHHSRYWKFMLLAGCTMMSAFAKGEELDVWLGTSASPASHGIYHCSLDTEA